MSGSGQRADVLLSFLLGFIASGEELMHFLPRPILSLEFLVVNDRTARGGRSQWAFFSARRRRGRFRLVNEASRKQRNECCRSGIHNVPLVTFVAQGVSWCCDHGRLKERFYTGT